MPKSSPLTSNPQQYAAPPEVTPQVWYTHAALTVAKVRPPVTGTGVELWYIDITPSPSSP